MIDREIVRLLIEAGSFADPESSEAVVMLERVRDQDQINRLHWSEWDEVCQSLSVDALVVLIKALTFAESRFSWIGGSVSAVIWTYRALANCDSEQAAQLADWIFLRTTNPYNPFGSNNYGAKSLQEYEIARQQHIRRRGQSHQRIEDEVAKAKQRRINKKLIGQARKEKQHKESELRLAALKGLASKSAPERLRKISLDQSHPVNYYPIEFAEVADSDLEMPPVETIDFLMVKLQDRKKGPWKKLYQQSLDKKNTTCTSL